MERLSLQEVPLFAGLGDADLVRLRERARLIEAGRGEAFFTQDDEAMRLFVLIEGRVKITQLTPDGQQVTLRMIGPGQMFGCGPVFSQSRYPGSALAVEPSTALAWTAADADAMVAESTKVACNALAIMGARIREMETRFRELATERVERRLANTLLRLARTSGRNTARGLAINFPLTRQDLAEMAGTTLYTVSRILSAWEEAGVVNGGRSKVVIRDLAALERLGHVEE